MPLSMIVVIVLIISAVRKGTDTPQNILCAVLGDQSNGTLMEESINMAGNLIEKVWNLIEKIWGGGGGPAPPSGLLHASHVLHTVGTAAGIVG